MSSAQASALGDLLSQVGLRLILLIITISVCALALQAVAVLRANRAKIDQEISHISNVQIAHLATMAVHAAEQAPELLAASGLEQRDWAITWLTLLTGLPKNVCALGVDAAFHGLKMAGQIEHASASSAPSASAGVGSEGGGGTSSLPLGEIAPLPMTPADLPGAPGPENVQEDAPEIALPPSSRIATAAGLATVGDSHTGEFLKAKAETVLDSLARDGGAH